MQRGIASVIVVGALLVAGTARAQTAGPSVGPDIVPLTGPSTASGLPRLATPAPMVAPAPAGAPKDAALRSDAAIGKPAPPSASTRRAVKVAHKPGAKATVKKASTSKRVAKVAPRTAKPKHVATAKPKHMATAKRSAPARQATVGAPIPLSQPQPAAKGAAAPTAPKPVLPRV